MSVNVAQIEAIANQLFNIASMFSPQVAAGRGIADALIALFKSGQALNGLIKEIMEQNPENADEVMAAVIADYKASADALQAALDAAKVNPTP